MTDAGDSSPLDPFGRFRPTSAERREFLRTDTEATLHNVRRLVAAAVYFNAATVTDYGGRLGPTRGIELIEQVIGAAFQTFGGYDPHPDVFSKAAMLLRGITAGHPFQDGNKRNGILVAAFYLEAAGLAVPPTLLVGTVVELCRRVSAGELRDVAPIAHELERLWGR